MAKETKKKATKERESQVEAALRKTEDDDRETLSDVDSYAEYRKKQKGKKVVAQA